MWYEQFDRLCDEKGTTPTAFVTNVLGLSSSKVTAWKQGSIPKIEILQQIADYFQVTVGFLFDGKEKSPKSELSDLELELLEKFNRLKEVDKGRILGRMDIILDEYNRPIENAKTARAAAFGGKTQKVPDLDISLNDRIDAIERQALIDEIKANQDPEGN